MPVLGALPLSCSSGRVLSWRDQNSLFIDIIKMLQPCWHCSTWEVYSHVCDVINSSHMLWRAVHRSGFWWTSMAGLSVQKLNMAAPHPCQSPAPLSSCECCKVSFPFTMQILPVSSHISPLFEAFLPLFAQSRPWFPSVDWTYSFKFLDEMGGDVLCRQHSTVLEKLDLPGQTLFWPRMSLYSPSLWPQLPACSVGITESIVWPRESRAKGISQPTTLLWDFSCLGRQPHVSISNESPYSLIKLVSNNWVLGAPSQGLLTHSPLPLFNNQGQK